MSRGMGSAHRSSYPMFFSTIVVFEVELPEAHVDLLLQDLADVDLGDPQVAMGVPLHLLDRV